MPYIFPKRALNDEDVLDPVDLNEDIAPAADLYSGRLDEHNFERRGLFGGGFSAELNTGVAVTPDSTYSDPIISNSYYNVYFVQRSADPGWGTVSNYNVPGSNTNRWILKNVPAWQAVTFGTNKSGTIKIFTGNSKLWVIACFQYIWHGFSSVGGHQYSYPPASDGSTTNAGKWARYPCMVQFALRVDGTIIDATKTGFDDYSRKVVQPWKMTQQRATGDEIKAKDAGIGMQPLMPGPSTDGEPNCGALAPECHNIRLGSWVPVSGGTHTVEIVARRLDVTPYRSGPNDEDDDIVADQVSYQQSNRIALHNRQLLVIDYPILPPSVSPTASVVTGSFDSEDTISADSLGTRKVDRVRDSYNAVQRGAVDRGALNHRHLTSKVAYAAMGSINKVLGTAGTGPNWVIANQGGPAPETMSNWYPGYGDDTVVAASSGSVAWHGPMTLEGEYLRVEPGRAFSKNSVIILLGNVEITKMNEHQSTYVGRSSASQFCALCIFTKVASVSATQYAISEGVINRDTNMASTTTPYQGGYGTTPMVYGQLDPVAHDVPLMQVIRIGGTSVDSNGNTMNAQYAKNTTFEQFYIAGSTMSLDGDGGNYYTSAKYWHGSLTCLVLEE
jgi:hypothetical protein